MRGGPGLVAPKEGVERDGHPVWHDSHVQRHLRKRQSSTVGLSQQRVCENIIYPRYVFRPTAKIKLGCDELQRAQKRQQPPVPTRSGVDRRHDRGVVALEQHRLATPRGTSDHGRHQHRIELLGRDRLIAPWQRPRRCKTPPRRRGDSNGAVAPTARRVRLHAQRRSP